MHLRWRRDAGRAQNRRRNIHQAGASFYPPPRLTIERQLDQQRNVKGFVVEKHSVRVLTVRPQRLAVIRHHRNQGFVVETVLAQRVQQFADAGVRISDFSVVGLRGVAFLEWRRRIVGVMRIVQMHPQEERPIGHLAEPSQGVIYHHRGAPLDRLVAVGAVAAQPKTRVINVEAAIKSRRSAVQRIENQRCHEGPSLVSVVMQYVGQIGEIG